MDFQDCIDFVLRNPNGFAATAEGDHPHVRVLTAWRADRTGIYFYLPKFKPVYHQLCANPQVEIAFHQPAAPREVLTVPDIGTIPSTGTLLRITGRLEFTGDADTRQRLFNLQPWLLKLVDGTDNPMIAIFRIAQGTFSFWTFANNSQSNPAPQISFP